MSDEEFLALKNQIKEVGDMCHKINSTFRELRIEISGLDATFSQLDRDVIKLKSDVNSMKVF